MSARRPTRPDRSGPTGTTSVSHGGRDLYLTALPVAERGEPIGFLMLLHDRGFAEPAREAAAAAADRHLRRAGVRGLAADDLRDARLVARLDQRDPPRAARRDAQAGVPAAAEGRPRPGGSAEPRARARRHGRDVDAAAAEGLAQALPARRARRRARQPRAVHPRLATPTAGSSCVIRPRGWSPRSSR